MSTVLFKRGNSADMADTAVTDGMLYFNEENHKIYMDNGTERLQYGGDTDLIDNPANAMLTNAFSARGSLDLFLQKTTVIDTKASALSVTQQYIPLGCLAFKESLGTTDFSELGDGTISGGLINLDTRVRSAQSGVNNLTSQLQVSGVNFYFDYKNGRYGWNSSSARGAGTFHPFDTTSLIGTGYSSYDIRNRTNWASLTVNDFLVVITGSKSKNKSYVNYGSGSREGNIGGMSISVSKSYSGGIFYVSGSINYSGELGSVDLDTSMDITSMLSVYVLK